MDNLIPSFVVLPTLYQSFTALITFFILLIILTFIILFLKSLFNKKDIPYYKNPHFLTPAELIFFNVLEQAINNSYYIFPQVSLASLVKTKGNGSEWYRNKNRIDKKIMDFVIADKISCTPLLVIELDDSSHLQMNRHERDLFLDNVFKQSEIPILHIRAKDGYSYSALKVEIETIIHPSSKV